MTLEAAIDVFVGGFCFTRSYTYPYVSEKIGPVWVMHDDPVRLPDKQRNTEWVACRITPNEMDRIVGENHFGRYALCYMRAIDQADGPIRKEFREMGYRLGHAEPFFVHALKDLPESVSECTIERVIHQELADLLAKAAGRKQILPLHLADPHAPIRQYVARVGDELIGWVRSITVGDSTWCSNLYVNPAYRRRGIGRALMAKMLEDDKAHGCKANVLLASHTGARLYPTLGYEQIGEMFIYTPPR